MQAFRHDISMPALLRSDNPHVAINPTLLGRCDSTESNQNNEV